MPTAGMKPHLLQEELKLDAPSRAEPSPWDSGPWFPSACPRLDWFLPLSDVSWESSAEHLCRWWPVCLGPTPASLLTLWHRTAPTAPRFSCLLDPRYPAPGGNGERLEGDEGQEPSESSLLSLCMFCSGRGGAQWLSGLPSVSCSAHRGWPWPWEAPPFPTVPPALGLVGTPAVADVWGGLTVHHWLLSSCIPM